VHLIILVGPKKQSQAVADLFFLSFFLSFLLSFYHMCTLESRDHQTMTSILEATVCFSVLHSVAVCCSSKYDSETIISTHEYCNDTPCMSTHM